MNDVEIKDIDGIAASASQIDKLKNLLIEFGVEFKEVNYEEIDCIDLMQLKDNYFVFNKDGSFSFIGD